uniref:Uncharacterized protein n=1 Tax=Aplanochytrium stocchinoi TaxID=215587 RepID=A0A7S3PKM6_9STRA|mmetsp:Transcript_16581/g.20479  ORF Transcript_16581/g.20479 Transcript_16581/m.20479 type:complete len:151 (-) Transcript_16581:1193-1645(-)|eukprot:CAMPEP_0204825578 /NCGR_PEP_ID=MMETSP1346-20131115/3439_1 /ASSEMBLY_ACC=CAM_ASM_000771 /TAXON_ID=215587 /ORGANISM="Aplanochytrium stocchinoi, Strain GSBS06" /LENGTH=150 /DNA_ID=CAMNT_0051953249 /DNA_START=393 /DNA_END=845 /DNA_ORIENTATION=+
MNADNSDKNKPKSKSFEGRVRKNKNGKARKRSNNSWKYIPVESRRERLKSDMVRPSVIVMLDDEDFMETFTTLWQEHIEGFSGKKRERTENEMNMEWRLRLKEKRKQKNMGKGSTQKAKKFKMTKGEKGQRLEAIQKYKMLKKQKSLMKR